MSTDFAMAMRWSTALVDPPVAITTVMAFSNALRVMMSRGLRSSASRLRMALPAAAHSSFLDWSMAGLDDEFGNDMPSASMAEAMVLAVYIPPQAPAPGQEFLMIPLKSSSLRLPAIFLPSASN